MKMLKSTSYKRLGKAPKQDQPSYVVRTNEQEVAFTKHKMPLMKTKSNNHYLYLQKTRYPNDNLYEFMVSELDVCNICYFMRNRYSRRNAMYEEIPGTIYNYLKYRLRLRFI